MDEPRLPDDDTELTRVTPPDDQTSVMPPVSEGATRVMPGEDAGPTRMMTAGDQAPPPPPAQPTLVMTRGGGPERKGVPWWVWLVVVLAVVAAAAFWYSFLRPSTARDGGDGADLAGTWSPESGAGGGLVIKESEDGLFTITQYDGQLQKAGDTTADLVDDQLEADLKASALGLTKVTGSVRGILTYEGDDRLKLSFVSGGSGLESLYYVRAEVLLPAPAPPTPSPTPSPTVTETPAASPSPSGSPTADQQTMTNIARLQTGIMAMAADHGDLYPRPQDVIQGGELSQYVDPWPTNPFTGAPAAPGTSSGSYVYEQLDGGKAYKLTGYLGNGLTYVVP